MSACDSAWVIGKAADSAVMPMPMPMPMLMLTVTVAGPVL
jgi:hypothetical protein